jgi:hypothetical protein
MHPDLENLMNIALADGEVSEKKRAIILRKAEALGEDKDEVEMILEGKLAQLKKQAKSSQESAGNIIKCPQCKADIPSFTTKCEFCGHEFRNMGVSNSVTKFFEKLEQLELTRSDDIKTGGFLSNNIFTKVLSGDALVSDRIAKQKSELISTFPVPNTKEDIFEFLALAVPRAKNIKSKASEMWSGKQNESEKTIAIAFKNKCEQIIMKAKFTFKDNPDILSEVNFYAEQLNIKM